MKFYIYTAIIFIVVFTFLQKNFYVFGNAYEGGYTYRFDVEYIIYGLAFCFAITFGAKWFLEFLKKPKK